MELIPEGKSHAIHLKALSLKAGMTQDRCKKYIREARIKGIFINSSTCGYWLPTTPQERQAIIDKHEKTARSYFFTTKALRESQKQIDGQMTLEEVTKEHEASKK